MTTQRQTSAGKWVPDIPLPFYGLRKRCHCGKRFWTLRRYQAHYALDHILEAGQVTEPAGADTGGGTSR